MAKAIVSDGDIKSCVAIEGVFVEVIVVGGEVGRGLGAKVGVVEVVVQALQGHFVLTHPHVVHVLQEALWCGVVI